MFSDNPGREAEIDRRPRRASDRPVAIRCRKPRRWSSSRSVSDGDASYAIVDSLDCGDRAQHLSRLRSCVHGRRQAAIRLGDRRAVSGARATDIAKFLERVKRDGTLARLIERYVPDLKQFQRLDASGLQDRARTTLPLYRHLFQDAQERTGIDWRLLAALAYQESQWDPAATSETGVRGFMQITEDTARQLGSRPIVSIRARTCWRGARYLRDLEDKLPPRIQEPDRTWLALAAFNIGLGHLEDARVLTQRQRLQSGSLERREEGAAAAGSARVLRKTRSSAMRAAACRSRSSIGCAATTTSCSHSRRPCSRACGCSPIAPPADPHGRSGGALPGTEHGRNALRCGHETCRDRR